MQFNTWRRMWRHHRRSLYTTNPTKQAYWLPKPAENQRRFDLVIEMQRTSQLYGNERTFFALYNQSMIVQTEDFSIIQPLQHNIVVCGINILATLEGSEDITTTTLQKQSQKPFDTDQVYQFAKEDLNRTLGTLAVAPSGEAVAELNLSFVSMMFHVSSHMREYTHFARERKFTQKSPTAQTNAGQFKGLQFVQPRYHVKSEQFERQWRQNYDQLKKFKEEFGHVNVTRVTKGYEHLGVWVADQRKKLRAGKMTRQRYDLLNEIGMEWDRSYYFKPSVYRNEHNNNNNRSNTKSTETLQ